MTKSKAGKSAKAKLRPTAIEPSAIIEDQFGNYRIRAGRLSGNFVARAFPKAGSNSQGLMAEAFGASEEEAIANLKQTLTAREARRSAARRWEPKVGISVPTREEYAEALRQTNLTEAQLSMLKAHAIAGERGLTAVALMNAAGYQSKEKAAKLFEKVGAIVVDFLGLEVTPDKGEGHTDAARALVYREISDKDARNASVMHEELRHAVWAMG